MCLGKETGSLKATPLDVWRMLGGHRAPTGTAFVLAGCTERQVFKH